MICLLSLHLSTLMVGSYPYRKHGALHIHSCACAQACARAHTHVQVRSESSDDFLRCVYPSRHRTRKFVCACMCAHECVCTRARRVTLQQLTLCVSPRTMLVLARAHTIIRDNSRCAYPPGHHATAFGRSLSASGTTLRIPPG